MHNSNIPSSQELPSSAKLLKSTIIAAITAVVILVTIVMPAEYGIDPTGVGKVLGLKRMGEIKVSLAKEAELDADPNQSTSGLSAAELEQPTVVEKASALNTHEMTVTLAPDEGREIKVTMPKGAAVDYAWETSGGKANFDVHGDSKALSIDYHNYYKGSEQMREGTLIAAFDGSHGWYWRNRTREPLTITLKTSGDYTEIKRY
jgi:hypothetical protein